MQKKFDVEDLMIECLLIKGNNSAIKNMILEYREDMLKSIRMYNEALKKIEKSKKTAFDLIEKCDLALQKLSEM